MKNVVFALSIGFFIFLSCEKNSDFEKKEIKICDYNRGDVDYNFYPDNSGKVIHELDLNNDNIIDFELGSYYMSSPNGYSGGTYLNVLDTTFMYSLSINNENYMCGDTLNENIKWKQNDTVFQSHYRFFPEAINERIENWIVNSGESAFIAVRYSDLNHIKYGWIKVENSEIQVVETAFER